MTDLGTPQTEQPLKWSLLALTVTAGCVDAASYLGLGQVFTANMTGNVVLLGFGLAGEGDLPIVAPIVSLVAFLAGAVVGGRLGRATEDDHRRLFLTAVALESALLALATIVVLVVDSARGTAGGFVAIALLATAMGIRTAAVRALAVPDLRTTVLTLTLAGLAADSPAAGGSGRRAPVQIAAAAAMLGGALVGALLERIDVAVPLAVAAVAALVTFAAYRTASVRRSVSAEAPGDRGHS